jgi:hypothetical protein
MKELCPCATECTWLPEQYGLDHHPDCPVMSAPYEATGHWTAQNGRYISGAVSVVANKLDVGLKLYFYITPPEGVLRGRLRRIEVSRAGSVIHTEDYKGSDPMPDYLEVVIK